MHAARISALCDMDLEEGAHLLEDQIERPGLETGCRGDRIGVHGITRPHDRAPFPFYSTNNGRQQIAHFFRTKPADQREAAWFVLRIENIDELEQFVGLARRAAFETKRILDAAAVFDMG